MNRLVPLALIVRAVGARRTSFKSCPSKLLVLASLDVVLVAAASVRIRA
jgi:hypothetical protein